MSTVEQNSHFSVSAAIIKIDSNWLIDAINQKAEEMTGMTAADLVGKPAKEVFCSKKEFADMLSLCEPVRQGKVISNHPIRICDNHGNNPRSVLVTILPLPKNNNQTEGALICLKDASELAYIQQIAMDCVADGVFTTDKDLNITSFNKAAETITGKKRQEVIGTPCPQTKQGNT
jgi:PAS domain S-box-containing protein